MGMNGHSVGHLKKTQFYNYSFQIKVTETKRFKTEVKNEFVYNAVKSERCANYFRLYFSTTNCRRSILTSAISPGSPFWP